MNLLLACCKQTICVHSKVLLPTATPRATSILFLYAKTTAEECSAALPCSKKARKVSQGERLWWMYKSPAQYSVFFVQCENFVGAGAPVMVHCVRCVTMTMTTCQDALRQLTWPCSAVCISNSSSDCDSTSYTFNSSGSKAVQNGESINFGRSL